MVLAQYVNETTERLFVVRSNRSRSHSLIKNKSVRFDADAARKNSWNNCVRCSVQFHRSTCSHSELAMSAQAPTMGDGGMHPPKNLRGDGYSTIPQYGWLTGQPSGPQHNEIAPAYSEPIGLVTVDSTSSSFTSISKISIGLGVRPQDPLLGLCPRTSLGDFRPSGYLPHCANPSP